MSDTLKTAVRDQYGTTARGGTDALGAARVAAAFGYSPEELAAIPEGANLGLSCGNPTATAKLRPGETVLDLGSGGGLDVFLAAKAVGPEGRAIGLDMTEGMIDLARRNAAKGGHENAAFVLGDIEDMPVETGTVDCVISNCVINLCPDKAAAFAEIARVLKPGGRVAISDIALKKPLPPALKESVAAYVGCIAGAALTAEIEEGLRAAGLTDIVVAPDGADLNAYAEVDGQAACCASAAEPAASSCCGPKPAPDAHEALRETMKAYDLNDYALSVKIYAVKPS
ncbi:arsenite methyltransferase [Parvularcula dongshanensis]|uniref:Arsenite methyltransferase n=1 Tax=Parvularcula dongshanensis TaxID=1173995 RepID=A0A840I018_9PROT|nr:arsenite methyltransferase [Parvularcula dongshanensis]MBB4658169.1 SAM-dependent methyltransferase [Parvularcula dongshanensis]